jgi:DNA-binding response OmpR family regulator
MDFEGSLRTVDVHVQRIRKKLNNDNLDAIIETVFGVGYMMRGA